MWTTHSFEAKILQMSREFFVQFGQRIRQYRLQKQMSQEALGLEAGISGAFIGMIERAEKDVTLSNVYKISKALNISMPDLFNFNQKL